jgi:iron complex transport system substrate-binding protein
MSKASFIRGPWALLLIPGALLALVFLVWLGPLRGESGREGQGRQEFSGPPPRRLISLAPSLTEILYFLELGDRLVGVTAYCNYPPEARTKPRIGTYWEFNLEAVLALKPDLVLVMADQGEGESSWAALRRWGIPLFLARADTLPELFSLIREVARLTGQEEVARRKLPALEDRARRIAARCQNCPTPRVFLQIDQEPLITVGQLAIQNDLINRAGGVNIAGHIHQRYPIFNLEEVLQAQPQVLLFTGMAGEQLLKSRRLFWQQWPMLPAVAADRLYWVEPDLIDRPGPRLVDGLELLARLFHPGS